MAVVLTACEGREPDLFDEDSNGAYFDYEYATDFEHTLNFSDYIVGNPDTVTVTLKVKLLGYLKDYARTLAVKTKDVVGYEPADVTIEEVIFANKEYEKEIEVKVKRPAVEGVVYAVCIYLDGSGDIGTGIDGKNEINLFVTESYEMPAMWYSHMDTYIGAWSKEKHIFLAQHTGNDRFYSSLYDGSSEMHDFDAIVALNVSAVNALLANEPQETIDVELPILKETDYPAYTKPYFWSEYEPLLGMFRANKFCRFINRELNSVFFDIQSNGIFFAFNIYNFAFFIIRNFNVCICIFKSFLSQMESLTTNVFEPLNCKRRKLTV